MNAPNLSPASWDYLSILVAHVQVVRYRSSPDRSDIEPSMHSRLQNYNDARRECWREGMSVVRQVSGVSLFRGTEELTWSGFSARGLEKRWKGDEG
jgi:hypothetical protein